MAQIKNKIQKTIEMKEVVLTIDDEGRFVITGDEIDGEIDFLNILRSFDGGLIDLKISDTIKIVESKDIEDHM